MELNSITATIGAKSPTVANVSLSYESGATKSRKMHLTDLVTLLKNATEQEVVDFKSKHFSIPRELVDLAYVDNNTFHGLFLIPGQKFLVNYCNKKYAVPYPSLLFSVKVVNGKVNETRVFAVKDKYVGADTVLYNFPFGNVYNGGNICWGSNTLPLISGVNEVLNKVILLFYSAETNSDLWNAQRINLKAIEGCHPILSSMYETLAQMEEFPSDALVPSGCKMASLY